METTGARNSENKLQFYDKMLHIRNKVTMFYQLAL